MADNFERVPIGLAGPVAAPGISPGALGVFPVAGPVAGPVAAPVAARRPARRPLALAVPGGTLRLVRDGGGKPWGGGETVRGPRDCTAILVPYCEPLPCEVFGLLLLDAQHKLIGGAPVEITRGTLNASLAHPREAFRAAIVGGAAAVVLWHNHPSGDPTPSGDDLAVTEQMAAAGRLLDIPVHDHVIIGAGRYYSFAESGTL